MYFCASSWPIDHRRVDVDAGMMPLDQRDPFRRGDDADHADHALRPAACSRSSAATALPPVASIGSIIST
jgi:hypothetical protein